MIYLILLLLLTGCSAVKEIEDYGIVSGIGIDIVDDKYEITAEFVVSKDLEKNDLEGEAISVLGDSFTDCLSKIANSYHKKPYYSHCDIIILGPSFRFESLYDVFFSILHDPDFRLTTSLAISKESSAKEILNFDNKATKIISYGINDELKANENVFNAGLHSSFFSSVNSAISSGVLYGIPTISLMEDAVKIDGMALFKDFYCVDLIEHDLVNTIKMVKGKIRNSPIILDDDVTPTIIDMKSDIVYNGDNNFTFKIFFRIVFYENPHLFDLRNFDDQIYMKSLVSNSLKNKMGVDINYFKEKNLDVFNLSDYIYRFFPSDYEKIANNFNLSTINLEIDIKSLTSGYALGQLTEENQ